MLSGFVNVVLLLLTTRFVPDTSTLPVLTTRRKNIDPSSTEAMGYTPFLLSGQVDEKAEPVRFKYRSPMSDTEYLQQSNPHTSRGSHSSVSSDLSEYLHYVSDEFHRHGHEGTGSRFSV